MKSLRGKSKKARKVFGEPPRDCAKCGHDGFVVDTRVTAHGITRRRSCYKGHRWTTVEILVEGSGPGIKSTELATNKLKRQMIDGLISDLKAMRP